MRGDDNPLVWITRNRKKPDRARSAGSLVSNLADGLAMGEGAAFKSAAAAIASLVDEEFRRHCRIAGAGGGLLVIHVDEAGLVGPMRLRWSTVLLDAFAREKSVRGMRRVYFEWGRSGAPVG